MTSTKFILKVLSLTFTLGALALVWVDVPVSTDDAMMKFCRALLIITAVELSKEYAECDKDNNKK